ncbi:MAG: hypothetical protein ABFR75_13980 [Acidobacteriota bacterium]
MKKIIVFLIFASFTFFVSGEKLAEFDNVYKPRNFQVAGDDLYIVDGGVIKYFSMKDFSFIKQIGKKGEGPGEFKWNPRIYAFSDYLFASDMGKVLFFTRKGELIKEKKIANRMWLEKMEKGYLGRKFEFLRKKLSAKIHLKILDNDLNIVKDIFTFTPDGLFVMVSGNTKRQDRHMVPHYTRATTDGKRAYLADTKRGFFLEIYDQKGNKINTININYKKREVSKEYKKDEMDKLKKFKSWESDKKRFNYIFPDFFPAFKLHIVNNGKIYLITYQTKEDKREIITIDNKGKILKRNFVPDERIYNIFNDKFYYFVDNEDDEVMEFHSIDL